MMHKLQFSRYEYRGEHLVEVKEEMVRVPDTIHDCIGKAARLYNTTRAGVIAMVLAYYFGDGANHLACEFCEYGGNPCMMPEKGEQTTLPLLDKGSVVIGQPSDEQGF